MLDPLVRERLVGMSDIMFSDNTKTWELGADGTYTKLVPPAGATLVRAQHRFIELLAKERVKQGENLSRGGRFHTLRVPQTEIDEVRRQKNGKKKKHLNS